MEDLLEDFIKYIIKLYTGPNRNIEIDKKVIKQPYKSFISIRNSKATLIEM